jgi:uncharacterized protein (DUF58 family)
MDWKKLLSDIVQSGGQRSLPGGTQRILDEPRAVTEPSGPSDGRGVDLVFVIDTTGSMSNKIESLLSTCAQFVEEFTALRLNQRIAIVSFGDLTVRGDKIQNTAFTTRVEVTQKSLKNIPRNSGGGNRGESSLEAMERALTLPFRPDAVKTIVLITDEPALQHKLHADDVIGQLVEREFLVFVASPPQGYFKDMARLTGGKWYQIAANTRFDDLLNMFRDLARKVSQVVFDVYQIGEGSVADYLRLKPPGR